MGIDELISRLRGSLWLTQKRELQRLWRVLPQTCNVDGEEVLIGDDAAALRTADGYLLLAAEGVYPPLLESDPYMAGRASVLANVNDIYAMGGRPTAILDVLFSRDDDEAELVLKGIQDNAARYKVPVLGGHLSPGAEGSALSVFILGKGRALLSSFNALPGDQLVFVFASEGRFLNGYKFWDSSSRLPDHQVLEQLELLPRVAEEGLADTAKDVSMAGLIGTALMLLEGSGVGAEIDLEKVPRPSEGPLEHWLLTFPSFGFLLSLRSASAPRVRALFRGAGLTCETIGEVTKDRRVFFVSPAGARKLFWDFNDSSLVGITPRPGTPGRN
jgi:AIR synthase-related protein